MLNLIIMVILCEYQHVLLMESHHTCPFAFLDYSSTSYAWKETLTRLTEISFCTALRMANVVYIHVYMRMYINLYLPNYVASYLAIYIARYY